MSDPRSLQLLRNSVTKALWDAGDTGRADEALQEIVERAERYEQTLRYIANHTEQTPHIDFQGKAREALTA